MKTAKRFLSVLLTACLLLGMIPGWALAAESSPVPFTDVQETDWFYDAVGYAYENSLMSGTGEGHFSPAMTTTRGMIVTVLYRLEGSPEGETAPFDDVAPGAYYAAGTGWAAANGVVAGYGDGRFGPEDPITREQMASILYRYAQYKEYDVTASGDVTTFADGAAVSSYAVAALNWAVGAGLLSGVGENRLNPGGSATRAEIAMILMNFCQGFEVELPGEDTPLGGEPTCTVTFDYNYSDKGTYETAEVNVGETVDKPANPTRSGYTFAGWYTKAVGGVKFDFDEAVAEDVTLYAHWNVVSSGGGSSGGGSSTPTPTPTPTPGPEGTFTVTFNSNGGSEVVAQSIYEGMTAFRPADPTREGFVFENWYSDEALTQVYDFNTPVTGNLTLYAKWNTLAVEITLDAGDYGDNIVNRTISGSIQYNIALEAITYALTSDAGTTTGEIALADAAEFQVYVTLYDGENTFTVTAVTVDGTSTTESITLTYDSGEVYDDGVYDGEDSRLIKNETGYEGEYLVANILNLYFYDHTTFAERKAFVEETLGFEVAGYLNALDLMQVWLPDALPLADGTSLALNEATEADLTAYAESLVEKYPNLLESVDLEYLYTNLTAQVDTNDPWGGYGSTSEALSDAAWWIDRIDANDAWEYDDYYNSDYFQHITLGVADTGVATGHDDLSGIVTPIGRKNMAQDHGTHVSGIIAANADNGVGLAGVTYDNAGIVSYDIFNGGSGTSSSKMLEALTKTVEAGAKVINFSVGSSNGIASGDYIRSDSWVKNQGKTASKGMGKLIGKGYDFIVVQAAGNGNAGYVGVDYQYNGNFCSINESNCYSSSGGWFSDAVSKQEILDRVVVVSNLQSDGTLNASSNGGSGENLIAAPGTDIYSTVCNGYDYKDGTSMAAPVVTGVCGLVWSVNRDLTGAEVVDLVMENTVGTAETNSAAHTTGGMGIVNALEAVEAAIETLPTYYGHVMDAVTGEPISATIKIHLGGVAGPAVGSEGTYTADADGLFTLPKLPQTMYTLEISAEGYVTAYSIFGAACALNEENTINLGTIGMNPVLDENAYRIILRWTGEPNDLDSHLVATTSDGEAYHVAYYDRNPSPAYANLDRDDVDYEGPETITITNFSELRNIRYAVHDYTNRYSSDSTVMSNSGAYIEVYKGSEKLETFYVPTNTGGTEWDVFALDANGTIIPMNQMTYCSDPSMVLGGGVTQALSLFSADAVSGAYEKE